MSQEGSGTNPEESGERAANAAFRRPGDSAGAPPPLKLQPLTRPGAPPPAPPSGSLGPQSPGQRPAPPSPPGAAQKIEFQQLELKGNRAGNGPPGVTIPPRPTTPPPRPVAPAPSSEAPDKPPNDVSGVVPRGWPPPRVSLKADEEAAESAESASRFLPGPEPGGSRPPLSRPARANAPKVDLGAPPDESAPGRGPMEAEPVASWSSEPDAQPEPVQEEAPRSRGRTRPRSAAAPNKRASALLVGGFAAVLLVVLFWPPRSSKSPGESSPTVAVEPGGESPVAVIDTPEPGTPVEVPSETMTAQPAVSATPAATSTPKPLLPDLFGHKKEPSATPRPVANHTASASPTPVAVKPIPVKTPVVSTPSPRPTPAPVVAVASPTPPPKPPVEEPPAKAPDTYYSVRVYVTPASVDSKVYLVNSGARFFEEGRGSVRLQPSKKGTYRLKVIAPGYETFEKEVKVEGEHNLAVRLEKIPPPPEPVYQPPPPSSGGYDPGPAPQPYYPPPPPPAPSGGYHQIQAPGI